MTAPNGQWTTLTAADGFRPAAWIARPAGEPRGAIVVVQEIFGVNSHIRAVCNGYANEGYVAIAPALFDRIRPGIDLGYDEKSIAEGIGLKAKSAAPSALADIDAARRAVEHDGAVGVVGYCWGGYLGWLAACRLNGLSAAVVYYGGGVGDVLGESPRCPVLGHFGERDKHIPLTVVDEWRRRHPTHPVHVYAADHGFNCDQRGSYDRAAADLARSRTLAFFARHLGGAG